MEKVAASIRAFNREYGFLSNFYYPAICRLDGEVYPTVENAYQAAKTLSPARRRAFRSCHPAHAKRLGRTVVLRPDWEVVKIEVMRDLLRQKFAEPRLQQKLLATGDAELVEGNHWGDTFWGVCNGKGENWLGILLMNVRAEIRV